MKTKNHYHDQIEAGMRSGEQLKIEGMEQAIAHANEVHENWAEQAYKFLLQYIQSHKTFMTEDVREASINIVPEPPSLRAFGGIIRKAATAGLIVRIGYSTVTNAKAHKCFASVWKVI